MRSDQALLPSVHLQMLWNGRDWPVPLTRRKFSRGQAIAATMCGAVAVKRMRLACHCTQATAGRSQTAASRYTASAGSPVAPNTAFSDAALERPLSAHARRTNAAKAMPVAVAVCMALLRVLGAPAMRLCPPIKP